MKPALTFALAAAAIAAFAGNSILTRLALATPDIAPAMFMGIRLVAGAATLLAIGSARGLPVRPGRSDAAGIVSLFIYALAFTYAYVAMGAATGALILFGVVQLTVSARALAGGSVPRIRDIAGIGIALLGLCWLLQPRASAPPLAAALMMISAGIAWGIYTIEGRKGGNAVARTARNFAGAAGLGLLWLLFVHPGFPGGHGLLLALASGIVTSALGYVIWYAVVPHLNVFTSGALQLLVPAIAAAGGFILLQEQLPAEFLLASLLILGGIGLTLKRAPTPSSPPAHRD